MAKKTLKRNEDGEKLRMYLIGLPLKDSSKWRISWRKNVKYRDIPELAKDKIEEVTGVKIFHVD